MNNRIFFPLFLSVCALCVACGATADKKAVTEASGATSPAAMVSTPQTPAPNATLKDTAKGIFSPATKLPPADMTAPPTKINWKTLEDAKFAEKYYPEINAYMLFPTFGPSLKALNGKYVELEGYIIPVEVSANLYVISAFTNASCFFCGQAGPNSVAELGLVKKHPEFRMDQWVCVRGILRLNDTDIDRMNIILDKATLCGE